MAHKLTTCTFCGVGCGVYLETAANKVVGAYPSMSHPANNGKICLRGWHVHEVAGSPDRLKKPLLKKNGRFQETTWDEALGFVAARLEEIRARYGPDSIAFLNSPRCSNEETYLLQKLARAVIGTNNVDHGAGVYCNNSIQVLLDMIGLPASTNSIADLSRSDVIVVDGVDLSRQLPTIGGCVIRAKLKGARLMVIDSRRHRVAESADLFLQIKPGTEIFLYGAMAKVIVDRGLANLAFLRSRCAGYEAFLERVLDYDLLQASELCGVPADAIEAAALAYARARSAALLYSTGIEARHADSIRAIVNLVLLTGNIGKEGAGLFPLTEQNNLQGVCDMGMLPDRLPGYQPLADSSARASLETLWKARLPSAPGLDARSVLSDRGGGRIKGLWLCRYDPVSTAFFGDAAKTVQHCELVVVQHLFMTDTARHADVILPTTAFGEERVSFTSTERRIQLAEQVIDPPAGPMAAWEQLTALGRRMGAGWEYPSTAAVMEEIGRAVSFYSGASYENLGRDYGRQWPCTKDQPLGTPVLFGDAALDGRDRRGTLCPLTAEIGIREARVQPNGHDGNHGAQPASKAPFHFVPVPRPMIAAPSEEFPFTMVFGHSLYYWHQNVLIKHSETLKREYRVLLLDYPEGFVEINTDDAKRLNIRDGSRIRLRAAGGAAVSTARVTPEVRSGTIVVPYFVRELEARIRGEVDDGSARAQVRLERDAP